VFALPPISFLGVEKADFRNFPYLYEFWGFLVKKIWFINWGESALAVPCMFLQTFLGGEVLKGN